MRPNVAIKAFAQASLAEWLQGLVEANRGWVNRLSFDRILSTTHEDILAQALKEASIDQLVPRYDDCYILTRREILINIGGETEVQTHVPGMYVVFAIPYEGAGETWDFYPSGTPSIPKPISGYPEIVVNESKKVICFSVEYPLEGYSEEDYRKASQDYISILKSVTDLIYNEVSEHIESIGIFLDTWLLARRNSAAKAIGMVEKIGFPLRMNAPPSYYPLKKQTHAVKVAPQKEPSSVGSSRYRIADDSYTLILDSLGSMSATIEHLPSTFAGMKEEEIRTIFLVNLNCYFSGMASAETFNGHGKTDILIKDGDTNIFIAECKFWKGKISFNKAINQLLGYLTWRDGRSALLVFNKRKNSALVAKAMHDVMISRAEHASSVAFDAMSPMKYVFHKPDERGTEIVITTMLFSIPHMSASSRS